MNRTNHAHVFAPSHPTISLRDSVHSTPVTPQFTSYDGMFVGFGCKYDDYPHLTTEHLLVDDSNVLLIVRLLQLSFHAHVFT